MICPDCGGAVTSGSTRCGHCDLDLTSPWATRLAQASASLVEIDGRIADLAARKGDWETYRETLRLAAPRVTLPDVATFAPVPPVPETPPQELHAPPVVEAPTAAQLPSPGASHEPAPTPARQIPAAVLLGMAGASLLIIAGIIFVAASWTHYGPPVRMVFLLCFAAVFAWLAKVAQGARLWSMAGTLTVVSSGFAGVAIYALGYGSDGPAPFSASTALAVAAAASLGLRAMGLRAAATTGAILTLSTVVAASVDALVTVRGTAGAGLGASIAAVGGTGLVLAARRIGRRVVARLFGVGGIVLAICGGVGSVLVMASSDHFSAVALAVWITCAAVFVATVWARPLAAWLPATLIWSLGVMALASMVGAPAGVAVAASVATSQAIIWGLRKVKHGIAVRAMIGLAPVAAALVVVILASWLGMVGALIGQDPAGSFPSFGAGPHAQWSLLWLALAQLAAAPTAHLVARLDQPPPSRAMQSVAGAVALAGIATAMVGAGAWTLGRGGASLGLAVAAAIGWFASAWWPQAAAWLRLACLWVTTVVATTAWWAIGGAHGADVWIASAALAIVLGLAAVAARRQASAPALFSAVLAVTVAVVALRLSDDWRVSSIATACCVLACAALGRVLPERTRGAWACGLAVPGAHVAIGALAVVAIELPVALGTSAPQELVGWWFGTAMAAALVLAVWLLPPLMPASSRRTARAAWGTLSLLFASIVTTGLVAGAWSWIAPGAAAVAAATAVVIGAVTRLPSLDASRAPVRVAMVAWVAVMGGAALVHAAAGDPWIPTAIGLAAALATLVAGLRYARGVSLPALILVGSLVAPALALPHGVDNALLAGASSLALTVWILSAIAPRGAFTIMAALPVGALGVANLAMVVPGWSASVADVWAEGPSHGTARELVGIAIALMTVLALPRVRALALVVVPTTWAASAVLIASPASWLSVVLLAAALLGASRALRGRLGWQPVVTQVLLAFAAAWAGPHLGAFSVVIGASAAAWTALCLMTPAGSLRRIAAGAASWSLAAAGWCVLVYAGLDVHRAGVVTAVIAFVAPVVFSFARVISANHAAWHLGVALVILPAITGRMDFAGVVVLFGAAAVLSLTSLGIRSARWYSLGLLTPATCLLLAARDVTTLEAYTALPAASALVAGVVAMRKVPQLRSVAALTPGLALALLPSYAAMVVYPNPLARMIALGVAAIALAVAGIALSWFAPVLATAVTAIVLSATQLFASDALFPRWVAVAIIGAVLIALGFLAERIRKLR